MPTYRYSCDECKRPQALAYMREVSPAVFVCRTCQDDASRAGLHVTLLTRLDLARAVLDGDERRKHHAARLWADLVQVRDLDRLHAAGVIA